MEYTCCQMIGRKNGETNTIHWVWERHCVFATNRGNVEDVQDTFMDINTLPVYSVHWVQVQNHVVSTVIYTHKDLSVPNSYTYTLTHKHTHSHTIQMHFLIERQIYQCTKLLIDLPCSVHEHNLNFALHVMYKYNLHVSKAPAVMCSKLHYSRGQRSEYLTLFFGAAYKTFVHTIVCKVESFISIYRDIGTINLDVQYLVLPFRN